MKNGTPRRMRHELPGWQRLVETVEVSGRGPCTGIQDSVGNPASSPESYDRLVKGWGLAGLTFLLLAVLAFGLWWIASPRLAEGDRLGFALQVAFYGLLSGGVAFWLGKSAGRGAEREASRRAAEVVRTRRERLEAQLAARMAEREEIATRIAENPRLTGGPAP
jgi:hypothetical protein